MFGEPAPTQGDIHFRLFGIPIRIHPFFWLVTIILGSNDPQLREMLIWVAAVFIGILAHELGHGLVLRAFGFHPWIVLYGMGGITCHDPAENYNSKGNTSWGQILVSFAGPLAGFLLAAALVGAVFLAGFGQQITFDWPLNLRPFWYESNSLMEILKGRMTLRATLVNDIFFISVFWGLINLLPIYPLDGGQIVREFLQIFNPREGQRQSLILSVLAAGLLAIFSAVKWQNWYVALMFGFLAYSSLMALQAYPRE